MSKIIALCGPKGSGKSTIAEELEEYSFSNNKISFTEPVKDMISSFLQFQGVDNETIHEMLDGNLKEIETEFLGGRSPRFFMQMLGTEFRNLINKNLWVDAIFNTINAFPKIETWIIDDLRFVHEAERVFMNDGVVVKLNREGTEIGEHRSEREFLEVKETFSVLNNREPNLVAEEIMTQIKNLENLE